MVESKNHGSNNPDKGDQLYTDPMADLSGDTILHPVEDVFTPYEIEAITDMVQVIAVSYTHLTLPTKRIV